MSKKMTVDSFTYGRIMRGPFNNFEEELDGSFIMGLGGICLTPDNKRMYVTVTLREMKRANGEFKGYPNTQLYYSKLENGSWTKLRPVTEINDENNAPTWEGQPTISNDGRLIIFATARPSSTAFMRGDQEYNSMDLYYIEVDETGRWLGPKNIGPVINTKGNEKTPFLHTDSRTLYFASNGHPGMGGYDIFYTKMDDNGIWSKPVNIGYPINTENDEHGLVVSLDGKFAYMSSGKEGQETGLDLIQFPLYPEARPEKVIFMKGKLEDDQGKAVKNGKIQIRDEATGEVREALVDEETGEYVAVMTVKDPERKELPKEKIKLELNGEIVEADYGSRVEEVNGEDEIIPPGGEVIELDGKDVVVKKGDQVKKIGGKEVLVPKGHEVVDEGGEQVVVPKKKEEQDKQRFVISATGDDMALNTQVIEADPDDIDGAETVRAEPVRVQKAKKGQSVRLNDVNFATNSSILNSKSMLVIDELKRYLEAKPNMKIAIHGHTDNVGDPKENLQLSKDRAKEVMEYLIYEGIDPSRLTFEGFGETQPKVSNASESGRAINRRVEFVILEL
jgi:outer membrane protein OmpA-like peptidoglycan-associated protein